MLHLRGTRNTTTNECYCCSVSTACVNRQLFANKFTVTTITSGQRKKPVNAGKLHRGDQGKLFSLGSSSVY